MLLGSISAGGGRKQSGPHQGSEGIDWLSLQADWVSVGGDPHLFWRLTLNEVKNVLSGHARRVNRKHRDRIWTVWHIEALQRSKKLPKLKEMMQGTAAAPKRRQTIEEQIAIAMRWTAALTR